MFIQLNTPFLLNKLLCWNSTEINLLSKVLPQFFILSFELSSLITMNKILQQIFRNIHTLLLVGVNISIACIIQVTFFCIEDVQTRNSSRIVEGTTASILFIYFILAFFPKTRLVRLILDLLTITLQIFIITYILILQTGNCGFYPSAKMGLGVGSATLIDRVVEVIVFFFQRQKERLLKEKAM